MAALSGREEVIEEDVRQSVDLALLHRMRRKPFQELDIDRQKLEGVMGGHSHAHTHTHTHPHTHTHAHSHNHSHSHMHPHGHSHHK